MTPEYAEAITLKLDSTLARSQLGWKPRVPLGSAIRWIVQFYQGWLGGEPAEMLMEQQFKRFEAAP